MTGCALPQALPASYPAGVTALNAGTHSPGNASAPIALAVASLPGKFASFFLEEFTSFFFAPEYLNRLDTFIVH